MTTDASQPGPNRQADTRPSPPIVVLGMHRSGTSLVAQILRAMGVYAGETEALLPADAFNPTGYWEHTEALRIDIAIVNELRASRHDVAGIDVGRLSSARRAELVAMMRRLADSLREHAPFLIKDPRIALLFPLWREALGDPVCVIPWREPAAVARSLVTRDHRRFDISLALWEHYNRTLLRDSASTPRTLVSYEQLLATPVDVTRALYDQMRRFGVPGLVLPSEQTLRRIIDVGLNRSGRNLTAERRSVTVAQQALAASLQTGTALAETVDTSPESLELLAAFSREEVEAQSRQ